MLGIGSRQLVSWVSEAVVVLENVAKKDTGRQVSQALRGRGYITRAFFIDSSSFGLPQSRNRLYVVGVSMHRAKLIISPDEWKTQLEAVS